MKSTNGQSLIELLLSIGLAALILPPLFTGLFTSREGRAQSTQRVVAVGLLQETVDAVRAIRGRGWDNIATPGIYHPATVSAQWQLSSGSQDINGFSRSVTISDVFRSPQGAISPTGVADPSTKQVDVAVSWPAPLNSSIASTFYLTRYLDNLAYLQTTAGEFNTGTLSNVAVTNNFGGEVQLAQNTKAKWCDPYLSSSTIDLPGKPIAVSAVEGHVFAATGETATASQVSFAHVLVGSSDPPSFTLDGTIKGFKTNSVFGNPDWGYLATSDNGREVVIINLHQFDDLPNRIYHQEGYFNTPSSNTDADALFILGNRGYVTASNYLYVFDLTSHSDSRPQVGSRINFANSGDKAGEIYVRSVGGHIYAYIAITGSTVEEIKIADVTNPSISSQWRIVGSLNIEPNNCSTLESGQAVYVNPDGDRAYISSVNDASFKEFFAIDTGNKSSPSLIGGVAPNPPCTTGGGYEAGGMNPEQSVVVGVAENRSVLVGVDDGTDGINSEEYQVLDLTSEAAPVRCGGLQFDQGIYGVAGVTEADGDAWAYLITGDSAHELKVVQGGPDGNFSDSGTFESAPFDAGISSAYNYFVATVSEPANTTLRMQFAAAPMVGGSCAASNYTFIGPDGSDSSFFTPVAASISASIPFGDFPTSYSNPGRCFKYRSYFTSADMFATPIFYDLTVNYSP